MSEKISLDSSDYNNNILPLCPIYIYYKNSKD